MMPSFEILSDEEFDDLGALLERYGSENSIASMSMLDGFLTAVVSGPHLIMPSTCSTRSGVVSRINQSGKARPSWSLNDTVSGSR
ncbi:UPF0149 family protein [Aeromonas veronii]